jgi:hypothetical protein
MSLLYFEQLVTSGPSVLPTASKTKCEVLLRPWPLANRISWKGGLETAIQHSEWLTLFLILIRNEKKKKVFSSIKRSDTLGISAIQANIMTWALQSCSTL